MSEKTGAVRLNDEESFDRLATTSLGRVVVSRSDDMDLFPLNYVAADGKIYFRTAEGTKLFTVAQINSRVLFEADNVDTDADGNPAQAWSVVVKGNARVLTSPDEVNAADRLPLKPWLPTLKYNYVEVTPSEISGREFELGEEPERY